MIQDPIDEGAKQAFDAAMAACIRADWESAVATLNRTVEIEPTCTAAQAYLGHVYYVTGKLEESVSALSRAIRMEPRLPAAYVLRAQCHERLGNVAEAVSDRETGLRLPGPKHLDYRHSSLIPTSDNWFCGIAFRPGMMSFAWSYDEGLQRP